VGDCCLTPSRIGSYAPVGDCCLTPTEQWREQVDDEVHFVLD
jgi:hypothetical protein